VEDILQTRSERGIALVVAMLMLFVLTLMVAMVMMSVNVDTKITGHTTRGARALNVAESGVSEALSMIRSGDIPSDGNNPRMVGQIYLVTNGSVPPPGSADSTFLYTHQPAGAWLRYSSESRGPDVLSVQYLTNPARTIIYRYDTTKPQPVNTVSGLPIMVINSTGRSGPDVKRVQVEVIQKPIVANVKAALAANVDIKFVGNAVVCGYNHNATATDPDGDNGRGNAPDCLPFETLGGDLPASWTTGTTTNGGAAGQSGVPPANPNLSGQAGFYNGPWEALNMTQAQFSQFMGTPVASPGNNLNGIIYVDNNATMGDQSTSLGIHGGTGEGMLYVDGDLTLNAGFSYRGLIYVEGDLKINGQAWVLGGLIVRGHGLVTQNGGATILYSSDEITRALSRFGGQFTTLSWKEK